MNELKKYDIDIFRLSSEAHHYEFKINSEFFLQFENSYVNKGDLTVELQLEKSSTMLQAYFVIEGNVELECDRSLESFMHPIHIEDDVIFKYGEDKDSGSDEIIMIPLNAQQINIAQPIYEFIGVAIPMKKLHPRFEDEDDIDLAYVSYEDRPIEKDENNETDPRWAVLEKLKKK